MMSFEILHYRGTEKKKVSPQQNSNLDVLIPLRTTSFVRACLLVLAILMYSLPRSRAADNSSARRKMDGSTAQAMSVLRMNCLNCHNDEKKKGGLRLTSRENALKGSDNGPVLV